MRDQKPIHLITEMVARIAVALFAGVGVGCPEERSCCNFHFRDEETGWGWGSREV